MRFNDQASQAALAAWRLNPEVRERACADNTHFEERVSDARLAACTAELGAIDGVEALRRSHIQYVQDFVEVQDGVPHTFDQDLDPARLSSVGVDPYLKIVRLESLERALFRWPRSTGADPLAALAELERAIKTNETAMVDDFLATWNDANTRDFRPAFAAWKHQLEVELARDDWADALRDRLGLGHYDGSDIAIPVALMEYRASDVMRAAADAGIENPFVAPTVLDIPPGPYFFPSPGDLPYGRVMSLVAIGSHDDLLCEMLHARLPYRRDHIARLGTIRRAPAPHGLRELRNNHLQAVRIAALRDDYGEEID